MPRLPTIYDLPRWSTPWLSLSPFFVLPLLDFLHNSVENWSCSMPTPNLEAGDTAVIQADLVPDLRSNQTSMRFPLHGLLSAFLQEEKAYVYNLLSVWSSMISDLRFKPILDPWLRNQNPEFCCSFSWFLFSLCFTSLFSLDINRMSWKKPLIGSGAPQSHFCKHSGAPQSHFCKHKFGITCLVWPM